MKKKKWLLIAVSILLFINLAFFILIRFVKIDKTIKDKLENYLSKRLQAEVTIKDFSFNDKQIDIIGFSAHHPDDQFLLTVDQIYIEYKFSRLFFSSFSGLKTLENIMIFEPNLQVKIGKKQEDQNIPSGLPNISNLFRELNIFDGTIAIAYQNDNLLIEQKLNGFTLNIVNSSFTVGQFQAFNADSSMIKGNFKLKKDRMLNFNLETTDFRVDKFETVLFSEIAMILDLEVNYDENGVHYAGEIGNLQLEREGMQISSLVLPFKGNIDSLCIQLDDLKVLETTFNGKVELFDLQTEPMLDGNLKTIDFNPRDYLPLLDGEVVAVIDLEGKLSAPRFIAELNMPQLMIDQERFQDIRINGEGDLTSINLDIESLFWKGNKFSGDAIYRVGSDLKYKLEGTNISWQQNELSVTGNLRLNGTYEEKNHYEIEFHDVRVDYIDYYLDNLSIDVSGENENFNLKLGDLTNNIDLRAEGNLSEKNFSGNLKLSSFDPGSLFGYQFFPLFSGNIKFKHQDGFTNLGTSIIVFDQDFGKLNGRFEAKLVINKPDNRMNFAFITKNMLFNYEPVEIELKSEGSLDSLEIKQFRINDEIELLGWIKSIPEIQYYVKCKVIDLDINDYLSYFMEDYLRDNFAGLINMDFNFDSRQNGVAFGILMVDDFRYRGIEKLHGKINFNGNKNVIRTDKFTIYTNRNPFLNVQVELKLPPAIAIRLDGEILNLELNSIMDDPDYFGLFNSCFLYQQDKECSLLDLNLTGENCRIGFLEADSIEVRLNQRDSLLYIDKAEISKKGIYNLQVGGLIGYNLITNTVYPDSNQVHIHYQGDLIRTLLGKSKNLEYGSSNTDINLDFHTGEEGLAIKNGRFVLTGGKMKIRNQPTLMEKLKLNFSITDNILEIKNFSLRMGEGKLTIQNRINNNDNDIYLNMVNLGSFYLKTDQQGILFHMPQYMPRNSIANTRITGRDQEYFQIKGPVDEIFMLGDIHFSNGSAVYPPETENLLTLFQRISGIPRKSEPTDFPFEFDIMMHFNENVRYVTYPLDLYVDEGSFLHLLYSTGTFRIPDARFTSEEGTIDIFGTRLQADYVQVFYDQYDRRIEIEAIFYRQAPDGTLITMEVSNIPHTDLQQEGVLNFDLRSDNPNDSRIDILALLRYGRRVDEISDAQKKTLLQDEVIQIAGIGIESAIVDPLISPVENWIRQALKLDFFHLQTNLIQNIFNRYSSDETDYVLNEAGEKQTQLTSDLFLNNLSIGMGKYISRKLFLDYQARFERPRELAVSSEMGVYHDFSIRYELPLQFRIVYKYKLVPFGEVDSQEILLEKSIRF